MVAELYSQLKELCHVDIDKYLTWFPENVTNVDMLKNIPDFPLVENLVDGLLFGLMLCLARFILDKLVFQPVGKWCMKLSGNEKFEHFSIGKEKMVTELKDTFIESNEELKHLGYPLKDLKEYFNLRNQVKTEEKLLHKFSEVSFKLICHLALTLYGIYFVVLKTDWMSDPLNSFWRNYPFNSIAFAHYWYYMAEFGYYIHEFTFFWFESKRSDDAIMLTHHIATLILISCSYITNMIPVGICVMVVHDIADAFLEFAKLFNYMKDARSWAEGVSDALFVCFAISFITSRCGAFPYLILYKGIFLARNVQVPSFLALDLLTGFLCVLQVLHIIWSWMIVRTAIGFLKGQAVDDERSMIEGLQNNLSTLTGEDMKNELEEKRKAIEKLDNLKKNSQTDKKNK